MSQRITTDDLISNIRQQLDEDNTFSVSDSADILPSLNRAQNFGIDILARHYPDSLLTSASIPVVAGQFEYAIPEEALEQRLLKVEANYTSIYSALTPISYLDVSPLEFTTSNSTTPSYYAIVGNNFRVYPGIGGVSNFRVWYLKDPLPLVKSQGRINILQSASNYIIVDSIGDDLTAVSDDLNSFVNIIDGASGLLKGTMQIQSIVGNKVTFKTVPTRSVVLDQTIDTDLANLNSGLVAAVDDYICVSSGTCVPFLKKPLSNFLIQFAVAEITRKLGGEAGLEEQVLQKFEAQVEKTWAARPNTLRVRKASSRWASSFRLPYSRS